MAGKCPICEGKNIIKKGERKGKQRYHCKDCFHNFSGDNKGVSFSNRFVWFKKWIMERQVYKYLIRDSGMSQSSLQRLFNYYLSSPPKNVIKSKGKVHLLIDGTYFSNGLCSVLYYDYDIQYVQLFRTTNKEKYTEIKEDLENLKKLGVQVYSVTCDGHNSIRKAVKKTYPHAIIQIFLFQHLKSTFFDHIAKFHCTASNNRYNKNLLPCLLIGHITSFVFDFPGIHTQARRPVLQIYQQQSIPNSSFFAPT